MARFDSVDLGDAVARALTGRTAGFVERLTRRPLPAQLGWLEARAGSAAAAARAAGIAPSTWRRWKTGATRTPKAKTLDRLHRAQRAAMVPEGRRQRITRATRGGRAPTPTRPTSTGAKLTATVQVSGDRRSRTLNLGAHLPPGRLDAVVTAYVESGADAAEAEFRQVVAEYLGGASSVIAITDVTAIDWS